MLVKNNIFKLAITIFDRSLTSAQPRIVNKIAAIHAYNVSHSYFVNRRNIVCIFKKYILLSKKGKSSAIVWILEREKSYFAKVFIC